MTSARDYNVDQLHAGHLTPEHVTELVRAWQAAHPPLEVDGMAGPATIASITATFRPAAFLHCPLPALADGRRAVITSGFRPPDRPGHYGCDFFYPWKTGDLPAAAGDHGAEGRNADGTPRWVVPTGTYAQSAARGRVTFAAMTPTGGAVWIDHGNGIRSGCFHLSSLVVTVGQVVEVGQPLGIVGDNPLDSDGSHCHFEVSPTDSYSPMDPELYLIR